MIGPHSGVRLIGIALGCFFLGAAPQPQPQNAPKPAAPPQPEFQDKMDRIAEVDADGIARVHGDSIWRQKSALKFDLNVECEGQKPIEATVICETNRGRARLTFKDGSIAVFDGEKVWYTGDQSYDAEARFRALAWPFFVQAPFRLHERGVQPKAYHTGILQGQPHDAIKLVLTNESNLPFPDPLTAFSDLRSHRLSALVFSTPTKNASADVSTRQAVSYHDYQTIDDVLLATRWSFWNWKSDVEGDPIGKATLSKFEFIGPEVGVFKQPEGSHEIANEAAAPAKPSDAGQPAKN